MPRPFSIAFLLALGVLLAVFLWDIPQPQGGGKPAGKNTAPPVPPAPFAIPAATALEHKTGAPRRRNGLGQAMAFREGTVETAELEKLKAAVPGENIALDFFPDARLRARVDWRSANPGDLRMAGPLEGFKPGDRFFLSATNDGGRLLVEIPSRNLAYEIEWDSRTRPVAREWLLTDVMCATPLRSRASRGMPPRRDQPIRAASAQSISPAQVPVLNTRPGAPDVIYMDFDGETVSGTAWAGGATIVAQPSTLSAPQIGEAIARMERDFEIFNVNITTQRSVFEAAQMDSRVHCIVTPTDTVDPKAGGIAWTGSFSDSEPAWKICWVFEQDTAKDCAEVASHEVGHTLGLSHDGLLASGSLPADDYYDGTGAGETGWAPIMGIGYYQALTQWSKGEYPRANNTEDDLAIITRPEMLAYMPDTVGNSAAAAQAAYGPGAKGSIERTGDTDFFRIRLPAGTHTVNLLPSPHTNLDAELAVQNSNGTELARSNPVGETDASATFSLSSNQTVLLRVAGAAKSDSQGTVYTNYGSLGTYSLTGFPNQLQAPSAPIGISTTPVSGTQIRISWATNQAASSYSVYRNGTLIGTTASTDFLDAGASPSAPFSYTVAASNEFGSSPFSEAANTATPAFDEFIMDGKPDFAGYLLSDPGMTIYAAVRGNRLYVATWSPGSQGGDNDHFLLVSNRLLSSAATPAPWVKSGITAMPGDAPYLAGESNSTYSGWANEPSGSTLFKSPKNYEALEGSIDLVAEFGSLPESIYIASIAYATGNGGGINAQAPPGNGNNNIEPSEFLRIPVASIRDRALNGTYDILDPARSFRPKSIGFDPQNRPVLVWDVVPSKRYTVHRASNLSGPWTILNAGGWNAEPWQREMIYTDTDPNLGGRRFYRITW